MNYKSCCIYEKLMPVSEMKMNTEGNFKTLSGVFGVCGVRNNNKRIYETSNYTKMVEDMQSRIKTEGAIAGELEHPEGMNISLENISHKIVDIQIDEKGVVSGTIQLLNTPKGKIAQEIIEGGLPLFVSSRAIGQIDEKGNVILEKIFTYDLVGTPGFTQARMHLNESQICECVDENMYIIITNEDKNDVNNNIMENINKTDIQNNNNKTENEDLNKTIENLQNQIEILNERLDNLTSFTESNDFLKELSDKIQNWILNEGLKDTNDNIDDLYDTLDNLTSFTESNDFLKELSDKIQNWILNEGLKDTNDNIDDLYDTLDNLTSFTESNDFLKELSDKIQNWIINEYSDNIQNWIINEYSDNIQNWIINELMPNVQSWIEECYGIDIKNMIDESLKADSKNKLSSIKDTLTLLESIDNENVRSQGKNIYPENMIHNANILNENFSDNEPEYIKNMPDEYVPKYKMASNAVKESIQRKAKIYNFAVPGSIDRFWESVDFSEPKTEQTTHRSKLMDSREKMIRESIRNWHNSMIK